LSSLDKSMFHDMITACVCVCVLVVTVECSEMQPEGGRDRLAKLFYHAVFAEGERRASLGNLGMDEAVAGHEMHATRGQFNSQLSISNVDSLVTYKCYINLFVISDQ